MKRLILRILSLVGVLAVARPVEAASTESEGSRPKKGERPNVLLVMADDMGYSDLGCFGGEINTPNINALAKAGIRFTSFCAAPSSAPTRSMLMSGSDNHLVGLGTQKEAQSDNQKGKPGYEGHINYRVATIASLLREAGYHTYMAGKWHLGTEIEHDPFNRGFERAYTLLQGGTSHFGDEWMMSADYTPTYRENGKRVHVPWEFYSSEFYADKIIEYIEGADDGKPFFAYLAFTAAHDPLHVPDDWLHKYKGRYDAGWDALRTERLERMKELKIVPANTELSHKPAMIPEWDSLSAEQKRFQARRMELHAALVENMDHHLGRVLDHLKRRGKYDNTLVLFLSDNGASPTEFHNYPGTTAEWVENNSDNRFENLGRRGSRIGIGPPWAIAANTPLRYFKGFHAEGGIRVPLIVAGPGLAGRGETSSAFVHVMDIAPTLMDVAGATHPDEFDGRKVLPMLGKSMLPVLEGRAEEVRGEDEAVGWEQFSRAIRRGRWKATWLPSPFGNDDWQLFDMETDISERDDLAEEHPEELRELVLLWEEYSDDVGVILPAVMFTLDD
ncbi:MAG: arylsulfatase [Planctomycetota bacterium]|jgi:arylsulfatase